MKLRSGKQTSGEISLERDTKKRSAKVSKMKGKRKKLFHSVNFTGRETAHSSLKKDGDEGCLQPMAVAASNVVSMTAVVRHSLGSTLRIAGTDESSVSPDISVTNDSIYFHQTSLNMTSIYSDINGHTNIAAVSSIRSSCSAKMSPSDGSNGRSTMPAYSPITGDVTKIRSEKEKCTMNVCSAIDNTVDKKLKCVEMVHEVNNSVLKNPSIKQEHQGILVETVSQKINDSFKTFKRNNQGLTQEDDSCSVISLGSDSEVKILDIDPEPQSDCSSTSDVVVIDTVSSTRHVATSDVVPLGSGTLSRNSNKFHPHECATRKSVGCHARKRRKKIKQKLKTVLEGDVCLLRNVLQTVQNKPNGLTSVRNLNVHPGILPNPTAVAARSNFAPASNFGVGWMQGRAFTAISSTVGYNQMNVTSAVSAGVQGSGLQHWTNNAVRVGLQPFNNRVDLTSAPCASLYGTNLYNPNPNPVRSGLRPIIIDGSNVAMG